MRILFVADGRSPTTHSWLAYWLDHGHEVHLVSTFPCDPLSGLASFHVIPVAFNRLVRSTSTAASTKTSRPAWYSRLRDPLRRLRYILGPLSLPFHRLRFRRLAAAIQPQLIHALRIPFEGMLAMGAPASIPLVVSIWGNDLILHAHGSPLMRRLTRQVLRRSRGLMADASRDIRLARQMGFTGSSLVVPGAGGIRLEAIQAARGVELPAPLPDAPLVVNPRGHRPGSLRQDVFFQAIPLVLEKLPQTVFVCPPLKGDPDAEHWVVSLGIAENVLLWPRLSQPQLWALYHRAQVYVTPSIHDGLPNSLLEAMACGCFPVVGQVESLQEWVTSGVNGLVVDASDAHALASALITALTDAPLRLRALKENARRIADSAGYGRCMAAAEAFYQGLLEPVSR